MHKYCYNVDCSFSVWPDGRPYTEQADVTVKMLMIINDEVKTIKGT
jgi:hypothetical protein